MIDENLEPVIPTLGDEPLEDVPFEEAAITQKKMQDALRAVSTSWLAKLKQSQKHKKQFSDDAREAMNFFDGQQ